MEEPEESNRGKVVALVVLALIVLGGIWLEQRLSAGGEDPGLRDGGADELRAGGDDAWVGERWRVVAAGALDGS